MPKVTVDQEKCIGCGACVEACPNGKFKLDNGKAVVVMENECIACHACEGVCPAEAIKVED